MARRRATVTPAEFNRQWEAAETILERIKHSCYRSHILYKQRYLVSRERLTLFDVPIIVFSSVNSVLIAGGKNFIDEDVIEITTCMLALATGIIQALRTFFKVDENRENCLTSYKDLFRLFCEISIILDQPRVTRGVDPQKFMADKSSEYKEIMNKAIVLEYKKADRDPIYHDRHPWMHNYDMVPESESPRGGPQVTSALRTLSRTESVRADIGLPLATEDSTETPESLDQVPEVEENNESDNNNEVEDIRIDEPIP